MNWGIIIWLGIMLGFLVVEAACPIHLVSIWFAVGALAAAIAAALEAQLWLQVVLFLAVSAVLLACLWPFTRKVLNPGLQKTNVDAVVGSQGIVLEDVDNVAAQGRVKLGAMEWSARSADGSPIAKDTLVTVDRVEGVKFFVRPM